MGTASSRHRPEPPADDTRARTLAAAGWVIAAGLVTALLWVTRDALDKAHMALVFLLVVLVGSASRGRAVGLGLAVVCFLAFNFFLLPPYHTFRVADPLDWGVLAAFLTTAAIAAQLLYRAQQQMRIATARAEEIDRLSVLGAETLNVGRAEEAVTAIARVIRSTLRLAGCEIWTFDPATRVFHCAASVHAAREGEPDGAHRCFPAVLEQRKLATERAGAEPRLTSHSIDRLGMALREDGRVTRVTVPLIVRGQGVGLLRMNDIEPIRLDDAQERFTQVLSYYAALGIERIQLVAEADRLQALREADRLREALIAGVSHDLRTPLTTIKALAWELRSTGDERAVAIEEEADRLNRLVSDLLDISRLEAGALPVQAEIVAAEDLVGTALQRVEGARAGREIRVALPLADGVLAGRFDFGHAVRALVNLLENALKYSPPDAAVELEVARTDDRLAVSVLDRGPGVPAAEADRIFEPFYRPAAATPEVAGTGLGLAIARQLAEVQGGAVRYAPRTGGGSVFTLILPAADVAMAEPDHASGRLPDPAAPPESRPAS